MGLRLGQKHAPMRLESVDDSTKILIHTENVKMGTLRLWVPEAFASNTGFSAVYPVGTWRAEGGEFKHTVADDGLIGPGSFRRLDESVLESLGSLKSLNSCFYTGKAKVACPGI